ncbi:transmembrane protein, putative [Medicago truncatula]|uniref:Transmembrane protein, putative n=1 Tax=Medicago truncatula TaxID=3880 RepID=A0A072U460_MEDTR|nr:transmembrane protein, putative [Medicago truncatula]
MQWICLFYTMLDVFNIGMRIGNCKSIQREPGIRYKPFWSQSEPDHKSLVLGAMVPMDNSHLAMLTALLLQAPLIGGFTNEKIQALANVWTSPSPSKVIVFSWQLHLDRAHVRANLLHHMVICVTFSYVSRSALVVFGLHLIWIWFLS